MPHPPTPLKFLGPPWFTVVLGLCGLAMAWLRATPLLGDVAGAVSVALAAIAAGVAAVLFVGTVLRAQRFPEALAEDFTHPVRQSIWAAAPIALVLLASLASAFVGVSVWTRGLWMLGAVLLLAMTVRLLARWLTWNEAARKAGFWPMVSPVLLMPVVGNVTLPLAGVSMGLPEWAMVQFAIGVFFWPIVTTLLIVRIGVQGLWPDRLLASTFITITPASLIGLDLLQFGAPVSLAWAMFGVALFFFLWSMSLFRRVVSQPFSINFWGLSFPLAAFSALTVRLAEGGLFQTFAVGLLAFTSAVIAFLAIATFKGLRDGTLLTPEPVASITPTSA